MRQNITNRVRKHYIKIKMVILGGSRHRNSASSAFAVQTRKGSFGYFAKGYKMEDLMKI